ncbi:hypothetical protein AOQ87_00975 [Candidatus Riesia pediculischaeffi]|uniref:Ubiquinone biosynthesis accessory factor UbiK n=2 Tax=Candidatus Riesia pediculischaeffi TaxID=428411 RepID=A0A1V0HKA8_9ENTR|nr:accessory factor UbiK family protein [Candidatus Riesia pediculischaeffi]ARC53260.1 hypothetical protein AOQ87_00975 [Candidatus Riesia pediculischaeffi]
MEIKGIIHMIKKVVLEEIRNVKNDIEKKVKFIISKKIEKLRMVSKEEYEVQSEILSNIVKKISEVEKRIQKLEKIANFKPHYDD